MGIVSLSHVNVRTLDLDSSIAFYQDLLGLRYQEGPSIMGNTPRWLFDENGRDVLHLQLKEPGSDHSGPVDHVAFECRGRQMMRDRLADRGINAQELELEDGRLLIFIRDPHGISIELGFDKND